MRKNSVIVAACLALVSGAAVASPVGSLLNNVGLYGEYAGVSSQNGSSSGGVGARVETYLDGFYGDADASYTPGSLNNTTSGNSADVNIKLGYGLPIGNSLVVGPYVGYQYLGITDQVYGDSATFSNNSLGGGVFAAWAPGSRWGVQAHIGYLAGVSASVSGTGGFDYGIQSANLLDIGGEIDYRLSGPWSLFAGLHYAHYMESGASLNLIRGVIGASLAF